LSSPKIIYSNITHYFQYSFFLFVYSDYVHGIWQKEEDVVEESLGNFSLLSKDKQEKQVIKRAERISLVFWNM
jgi:hypothetical protein